jgi:hypothetical protein
MPRLAYSDRFAGDMARVTSEKVEARIGGALDNIEAFGEFGSKIVPDSIRREFGPSVRKVVVDPFDLVYTYFHDEDLARIEALIRQRAAE